MDMPDTGRPNVDVGERLMRHIKFLRDDSGQMLWFIAVSLTVLMGFLAFAVDMGLLFRSQRNMQIAADAAAVATALDYKYNGSGSSNYAAGIAAASANGVTVSTNCTADNGAEVCLSCPPADGPNTSSPGIFCEAIVSQPNSTFFMGLFNHNLMTVAARAVAGAGTSQGCLWALGKSGVDIPITGSGSIDIPTCDVYDDSSASDALELTGSGGIEAQEIGIVGNYTDTGSGSIDICNPTCEKGTPMTGMAPAASPITLSPPDIPTATSPSCSGSNAACNPSCDSYSNCNCTSASTCSCTGNTATCTCNTTSCTLQPGTYTSITNSGSGAINLAAGNYNVTGNISASGSGALSLGAGNYVVNGSIQASGAGALTLGAGDYIVNGSLDESGSGPVTLGNGDYTIAKNFTDTSSGALSIGSGMVITEGNLDLTGSSSLTANQGTTFFTEGSTTVTGSGSMDIVAPTSGPYNGIAFYQPATDSNPISVTGSGGLLVDGIFYAPDSKMTFSGSGGGTSYADFIVDAIDFTGSASFKSYQTINASALLGKVALVE